MLGYLLGRRATKEQRVSVERKCATRTSAVKQCLAANPGDARACDAFGQDLDLCKGRVVCPDAAAAFEREALALGLLPRRHDVFGGTHDVRYDDCLLYTSPSPRDISGSRMPSSA